MKKQIASIEKNSVPVIGFIGLQSFSSCARPVKVRIIVAIEATVLGSIVLVVKYKNAYTAATLIIKARAPGIAFFIKFTINLPLIRSVFGLRAKKNEGMPITKYSRRISCNGSNGYC